MLIRIAQYFMQAFKQTKGACDMDIPTKKRDRKKIAKTLGFAKCISKSFRSNNNKKSMNKWQIAAPNATIRWIETILHAHVRSRVGIQSLLLAFCFCCCWLSPRALINREEEVVANSMLHWKHRQQQMYSLFLPTQRFVPQGYKHECAVAVLIVFHAKWWWW